MRLRAGAIILAALCVIAGACGNDDGGGDSTGGSTTTAAETSTDGTSPEDETSTTVAGGTTVEDALPGDEWETIDPAEAGVDAAALDELSELAGANDSNCLVVTRHGRLVGEWYWNDYTATTGQEVFSTTKSFTAGLLGLLSDAGDVDLQAPASQYITEWQDTDSADVTVENLLRNDSGRYYDFDTDYNQMAVAARDKTAFAVALDQQHPPGTHWEYNNSAIQTLEAVAESAVGDSDVASWAEANLLEPLGMTSSDWRTDPSGNAMTFAGLKSTCQDLARYGLLWLRNGRWGDTQLISPDYVEAATAPDELEAYGYLWWLNTGDEPRWEEAPEDAFAALGLGGQIIAVFPDTGIVVTRMASFSERVTGDLINLASALPE